MQRIIAAPRKIAIYRNQILHRTDFAGQHDTITRQAELLRFSSALQGGYDQRLAHHRIGVERNREFCIVIHHARDQLRIEAQG